MYKLSKVGQAIDNNDLSTASSVLGGSTDTDWVKKANIAFTKVKAIIYVLDVVCILVACIVLLLEEIPCCHWCLCLHQGNHWRGRVQPLDSIKKCCSVELKINVSAFLRSPFCIKVSIS